MQQFIILGSPLIVSVITSLIKKLPTFAVQDEKRKLRIRTLSAFISLILVFLTCYMGGMYDEATITDAVTTFFAALYPWLASEGLYSVTVKK